MCGCGYQLRRHLEKYLGDISAERRIQKFGEAACCAEFDGLSDRWNRDFPDGGIFGRSGNVGVKRCNL